MTRVAIPRLKVMPSNVLHHEWCVVEPQIFQLIHGSIFFETEGTIVVTVHGFEMMPVDKS